VLGVRCLSGTHTHHLRYARVPFLLCKFHITCSPREHVPCDEQQLRAVLIIITGCVLEAVHGMQFSVLTRSATSRRLWPTAEHGRGLSDDFPALEDTMISRQDTAPVISTHAA
jgi:hypothetical protein